MFSWEDLFLELYKLRQDTLKGLSSLDKQNLSISSPFGIVTFRIGADGVARMIGSRTRAIRKRTKKSRTTLITGKITFWEPHDLCDRLVLEPLLGLDNHTSKVFFSRLKESSSVYKSLAERIWDEGNAIAKLIAETVEQDALSFLFVDNINSLPYNICAALGTVLASERHKVPVINVCHDFFWQHSRRTRAKFWVNAEIFTVAGLLNILCPWRSPLWLQITATRTAREWLLSRGWSANETEIIPYGMEPVRQDYESSDVFVAHLGEIPCRTGFSSDSIQSSSPIRICSGKSPPVGIDNQSRKRWIVTVPTKISSGKQIQLAVKLFHLLLQQQAIQTLLTENDLVPTLIVVGPPYDVSEDISYLQEIVEHTDVLLSDTKLLSMLGNPVEVIFLKGISNLAMQGVYSSTNLVLFCSRVEMWGLPILEAAHFGLPIIVREYDGIHRRIFDEVSQGLTLFTVLETDTKMPIIGSSTIKAIVSPEVLGALKLHNSNFARSNLNDDLVAIAVERVLLRLKQNIDSAIGDGENRAGKTHLETNKLDRVSNLASLLLGKANRSRKQPLVVALLAPPGWGKTTLAEAVVKQINEMTNHTDSADTLSLDDFGLPLARMKELGLSFVPESLRIKDLIRVISLIQLGQAVPAPRFVHGSPVREWRIAKATNILVLEGIFVFWENGTGVDGGKYESLQNMIDLRIYVKTDTSRAIKSLVLRDMKRKMTIDQIMERFRERECQVREYFLPFEQKADIVISTDKGGGFRNITEITEKGN